MCVAQINTARNIAAMKTWNQTAKERMRELGISQEKLAERLGCTQGAIGHWLNGRREPKLEVINQILAALDLPQLELRSGELASNVEPGPAITRPFKSVPIVGTAQMGTEGYWHALDEADGFVDVPSTDPGAYALRLKGNSMAPAIKSGWIAVIEPSRDFFPSEYVMVRLHDGECMLKELLYSNDVEVSLASANDAYDRRTIPMDQVEHIHAVGAIVPPSKVRLQL